VETSESPEDAYYYDIELEKFEREIAPKTIYIWKAEG
jgi:hypothetical protein